MQEVKSYSRGPYLGLRPVPLCRASFSLLSSRCKSSFAFCKAPPFKHKCWCHPKAIIYTKKCILSCLLFRLVQSMMAFDFPEPCRVGTRTLLVPSWSPYQDESCLFILTASQCTCLILILLSHSPQSPNHILYYPHTYLVLQGSNVNFK